jgi:hypothetical protein
MQMNDASRARRFLVTFDLLLLAAGIALSFVASVNGLGFFLCAAAVGLKQSRRSDENVERLQDNLLTERSTISVASWPA